MYAYGGAWIVPIIAPARVMKMDDEITVVRDYSIAESDLTNRLPVSNGLPLALRKENKPRPFTSIRYGYVKVECAFGLGVTLVENMGQDFISNIFLVDRRMSGRGF